MIPVYFSLYFLFNTHHFYLSNTNMEIETMNNQSMVHPAWLMIIRISNVQEERLEKFFYIKYALRFRAEKCWVVIMKMCNSSKFRGKTIVFQMQNNQQTSGSLVIF